ncbi:MAG: hypothetical protein KAI95_05570, partial [Bacteroidales bacterium]|nr:hypothetical protein [Bacteroidales bacterium]
IQFTLNASTDEPMHNPAFVLTNWGESDISLNLHGKTLQRGKEFRYAHRQAMETTDLIIWMKADSDIPVIFTIRER